MNKNWVVYLTIYSGTLLPRRYLGYTYQKNIDEGYNGTPTSQKYGAIYESEQENNKQLFKTRVLKLFNTKEEATTFEAELQTKYDVVKSDEYFNMNIGGKDFCGRAKGYKVSPEGLANMSVSQMGKILTPEHKAKISAGLLAAELKGTFNHSDETKAILAETSTGNSNAKGHIKSPEWIAAHSGMLNHRADQTILILSHKVDGLFIGTRIQLQAAFPDYKWNKGNLCSMINGVLKTHRGWSRINISI